MTRVLHLSDPHFGAADAGVAAAFLELAAALAPDVTVLTGDLTMRARRAELAAARGFVDRLPRPHLVIPGNHDIPLANQPFDRFFRSFKRYREWFGDELEPELTTAGVQVVAINSARAFGFHPDWSEGRISAGQLVAMRRKFETGDPGHLRVMALHHPLLETPRVNRALVKPLRGLMETIDPLRIDLILCGHFHCSHVMPAGVPGGCWQSIISQAPTVCSTRLHTEPQGFHDIRIAGDEIDVVHYVFGTNEFVASGMSSFIRTAKGWRTR